MQFDKEASQNARLLWREERTTGCARLAQILTLRKRGLLRMTKGLHHYLWLGSTGSNGYREFPAWHSRALTPFLSNMASYM